ncbi:DUF1549 domain-containing protein [Roseimicrobium sp. ORNL1]|uniref:DUF1549 domain-containing protein n=1 Tax=Roseimicrobium sp. ORNL1 TaxID=2711231 RepID=UPI0013E11400|nr:DUF1549 domain-containing protein [Roseimicrobium sp. ORNL1]QIF02469.1 DUF1549 domain-containing protein [Roseimicrobium sp. ORNL1]
MRTFLLLLGCLPLLTACDAASEKRPQDQTAATPKPGNATPTETRLHTMADAIDAAIESRYIKENVPLPPEASDEVFLRRAYLGITGQLPPAQDTSQFLADATPDKRAASIDRLIESPAASEHLFQHFSEMLHLRGEAFGASLQRFLDWMRESLGNNMPYDTLVRSMITAKGSLQENPAVGWLLQAEGSVLPVTLDMCSVWLGYNLQCAACHDSPYSDATQMEFYQIAANFSTLRTVQRSPDGEEHFVGKTLPLQSSAELAVREDRMMNLRLPGDYMYRDGHSGDVVKPRLPELNRVGRNAVWHPAPPQWPLKSKPPMPAPKDLRETLAHWVTVENEARFSHAIASRLWIRMLGDGQAFSNDSEDLQLPLPMPGLNAMMSMLGGGSANGGSRCHAGPSFSNSMRPMGSHAFSLDMADLNDPVMSVLAAVMRDVGFDLREFQRVIWNTRAAQRDATPDAYGTAIASRFSAATGMVASPLMRRMSAEQIWDALVSLAGSNTTEQTSRDLPMVLEETHPLRVLGRSGRGWSDGDRAPLSPTIARWMMHSPLVLAVASPGSRVMMEMNRTADPDARIRQAFLSILSRNPTSRELELARELYGSTEMDTPSADSFLVWTLLNTSEFLFLH